MKTIYLIFLYSICFLPLYAQQDDGSVDLQELRYTEHWFNDIDEALTHFKTALYLDLSLEKRRDFPEEIFALKNLKILLLSYNYYTTIPDRIGEMQSLQILDLTGNYYMNTLPDGLWKLTQLEELIIKDNRLNASEIEKARRNLPNTRIIVD